jgi:predicted HAD superfamily hydrolase
MHQDRKVVSFDIFDTCVSRMHAYPRDLFYDLGLKLAPERWGVKRRHVFAKKFQRARILAEKIANWRKRSTSENVALHEVYANFHWLVRTGLRTEDLVTTEVELERESIYAIPSIAAEIEASRAAGSKVVFVSDMYLPSSLLTPVLRKNGLMAESDVLYVSCDFGLTKHSGSLFDHVLATEQLQASDLIHTGDNTWADVMMARQKGIKARHFACAELTPHEARIAGDKLPRSPSRTFLAAFSRRSRLTAPPPATPDSALDPLIHGIVVPFLVSYVLWVLDHARKEGIQRLYFVARDGEVLYKIAKELNAGDEALDLRYLYGSRRAWLSPSITMDTVAWRHLLVTAGQANSPKDIVARAGLEDIEAELVREHFGMSPECWGAPMGLGGARQFLETLLSDQRARELISSVAEKKRQVAVTYFKQEGLFDDVPWALVDAGWSLNSQAALKRILSDDVPHEPKGFYLALGRSHLSRDLAGEAFAFIPSPGSYLSRRRVVIEHCFMPSLHATTRCYELQRDGVRPVFGQEIRGSAEFAYAKRLHEVATSTARLVASNQRMRDMLKACRQDVLRSTEDFLRHPPSADAKAMAPFGTIADLRHEAAFVEPLCRPLGAKDIWAILLMTFSKRSNFQIPSFMWLEGSCALSPIHVRLVLRGMLWADLLKNHLTPVPA